MPSEASAYRQESRPGANREKEGSNFMGSSSTACAIRAFLFVAVSLFLFGCGGGGSSSSLAPAPTTALSVTVTFPQQGSNKVVAAAGSSSLDVFDLSGSQIASVALNGSGTYMVPSLAISKDYVIKARSGSMVLCALVNKAALAAASPQKNVNNITTTALIQVEKNLALTPGTLGQHATAEQVLNVSSAIGTTLLPASVENDITTALAACVSGVATQSQAQFASLANVVTGAVLANIDPAAFVAGTVPAANVTATIYTVSDTGVVSSASRVMDSTSLPQISSASSATFTVGTAGTFTVAGTGTLSVTGALPSGVTFNTATGALSGTPTSGNNGTYPLIFTATASGLTAIQVFTLTVNPASVTNPPQISSASSTIFTVGTAGTFAVTGTGTLSVSGALPSGVTFNAATGILSGTPASGSNGTYPLIFTATANGLTATQAFTLTINPPSITTFTVSGKISLGTGAGLAGVTVAISGSGSGSTVTDAGGTFSFSGVRNGTYTITPALAGYTLTPTSSTFSVNNGNIAGQNFTATQMNTGSITITF